MFELCKYYDISLLRYESMYESLVCKSMSMRKVFNDLKDREICYFFLIIIIILF